MLLGCMKSIENVICMLFMIVGTEVSKDKQYYCSNSTHDTSELTMGQHGWKQMSSLKLITNSLEDTANLLKGSSSRADIEKNI